MRKMLTVLVAIPLAAIIYGCDSNTGTLTEMARIQGEQAAKIDKITKLVEKQRRDIAVLRKQGEANAVLRAAMSKAIKAKLAKSGSSSQDKILQAALLLAEQGSSNISHQAINILGYLGGEKAESALLKMLEGSSHGRNSSSIINALVTMRSNKLRPVIIKLLKSNNYQDVEAATNALNNRSLQVLKKSDLPLLLKVLDEIPYDNNNRYRRNNMIKVVCRLDQKTGLKYICDGLETADINQQRDLIYIPAHGQINLSTKSWMKIIKILGEPNNQNFSVFQAVCAGVSRSGDLRLTDIVLPWAEFAVNNNNLRNSYINMLNRMRDPKTAEIFLDLCLNSKRNNNHYMNYLNNFPGIIQKDGKYQLVDDAAMKKLLENRAKRIARLNERDKRKAAKK